MDGLIIDCTGYTYEQVRNLEVLQYIDVLVDGPFVKNRTVGAALKGGDSMKKPHNIPILCILEHKTFGIFSPSNTSCPLSLHRRKRCDSCIGRAEIQIKLQKEIGEALRKGIEAGLKEGGIL